MDANIETIIADIIGQLERKENCTAYGEPQAFVCVEGNRNILITAETYGLEEKDHFYSIALNCNEKEYETNKFYGTDGVIESYDTSDLGKDGLRKGIKCLVESLTKLKDEYKIEISMTPDYKQNKTQPYFWVLYKNCGEWCNVNSGWSKTPEEAWSESCNYLNNYSSI